MARWVLAAAVLILMALKEVQLASSAEISTPIREDCKLVTDKLEKSNRLMCTNVTSYFFRKFDMQLNKTHSIFCENCTLPTIDENTFPFPNLNRNRIRTLYLVNSLIKNLKRSAFSRFPMLKVLILRNNSIDNIDSKAFSNMKELIQLDLSRNKLKILINYLFVELKNLDLLNMNKNDIFYIQPEAFNGLVNLKHLYLNDNFLSKLESSTFRHLSNLTILHIQNNHILEIHPLAFMNLKNLNFLYLNNNSISFLVQYNFQPLSNLIDLQLRYNNLKEIQTSSFNGLKTLRSLLLRDNQLDTIKPYGFIGLNSLQILDLTNNSFRNFSMDMVAEDMEKLMMLWLGRNNINNITIQYKIDVHHSLNYLDISDNNLTVLNYKLFRHKFPHIKEIYVSNNSLGCDNMVNMYNYFKNENVVVCYTEDCRTNSTTDFMSKVCEDEERAATKTSTKSVEEDQDGDFTTDFTTDNAPPKISFDGIVSKLALLILIIVLEIT